MKNVRLLYAVLVCWGAIFFATPASAALIWNWSFNGGDEAGTFETNGDVANLAGSFNFVIDPNSFMVTASAFRPALVGDSFSPDAGGDSGFLWDGVKATEFYRSGGTLTNGANFNTSDLAWRYSLFANSTSQLARVSDFVGFNGTGFQNLTLSGGPAPTGGGGNVPEPVTLSLFALGLAGFAATRRRKNA